MESRTEVAGQTFTSKGKIMGLSLTVSNDALGRFGILRAASNRNQNRE
jgi:hypothetical protein